MARDILLTDVPSVLRADLYVVAAPLGAGVVVEAHVLQLPGPDRPRWLARLSVSACGFLAMECRQLPVADTDKGRSRDPLRQSSRSG
jgi:uncharacterized membrane protein YeiH